MGDPEQRVERVLEDGLERIDSPEAARAVVSRLERLSEGATEAGRDDSAGQPSPSEAAATIEQASAQGAVADVLDKVAEQTVAPTPAAETVVTAAQKALAPRQQVAPRAGRGRRLLKEAVLRRMGPVNALRAAHCPGNKEAAQPCWPGKGAWVVAMLFTGGW